MATVVPCGPPFAATPRLAVEGLRDDDANARQGDTLNGATADLEFWYEFASTYSYLAAMRIEALAEAAGVEIRWRPSCSGRSSRRRLDQLAVSTSTRPRAATCARPRPRGRRHGLPPVTRPNPFPQNSLAATRAATYGADHGWLVPFSKAVFETSFARGESIAEPAAVARILDRIGLDGTAILRAAAGRPTRAASRSRARRRARGASTARRASWRGRRAVLGQRPAGAGARLGRGRPARGVAIAISPSSGPCRGSRAAGRPRPCRPG